MLKVVHNGIYKGGSLTNIPWWFWQFFHDFGLVLVLEKKEFSNNINVLRIYEG